MGKKALILWIGLAVCVLLIAWAIPAQQRARQFEPAKRAVGKMLLDPYSAHFEDLRFVANGARGDAVCGTMTQAD